MKPHALFGQRFSFGQRKGPQFGHKKLGLRFYVLPIVAVALLYSLVQMLGPETQSADVENRVAHITQDMAPIAPKFAADTSATSAYSLRNVFTEKPTAAAGQDSLPEEDMQDIAKELAHIEPGGTVMKPVAKTASLPARWRRSDAADTSQNVHAQKNSRTVKVARGDTLMDLLVKSDVPRTEAYEAIEALKKIYDPRDLRIGQGITVFFHEDPFVRDPTFSGLSIEKDMINTIRVKRDTNGHYVVNKDAKPVHSGFHAAQGKIDSSLYVSAEKSGMPDGVVIDLIRMYSWSVDFQRDIQKGDSFEVMYEEFRTEDGRRVPGRGEIVYAKLTLSGTEMPYYLFKDSSGDTDYFDHKGRSAKKTLMKTPIDGARLSSGFGMRRHPILGYNKMHKGVDFAAPRGTPIYAAGDGTIERIGRNGGYGKYIRIRHRNDLKTAYAHMKKFKSGLKRGSRVKQGQVIGYVGSTGRSTGPHLHYEVLVNNKQINPARLKMPTGKKLKGKNKKALDRLIADTQKRFRRLTGPQRLAAAE